jgi:hypothetical protein
MRYSAELIEAVQPFLNEGQNPSILMQMYPIAHDYLCHNRGEVIVNMFHQQGVLFPAVIVSTYERFFILERVWWGAQLKDQGVLKGGLHFGIRFRKYYHSVYTNPQLHHHLIFCNLTWGPRKFPELAHVFGVGDDTVNTRVIYEPLYINWIPEPQALRWFALCREQDLFWTEEWRVRKQLWDRTLSGTSQIQEGTPELYSDMNGIALPDEDLAREFENLRKPTGSLPQQQQTPALQSQQQAALPEPTQEQLNDPYFILQAYKERMDRGEVTEEEYELKKREVLSLV